MWIVRFIVAVGLILLVYAVIIAVFSLCGRREQLPDIDDVNG